jgi:hypothetical protein
MDVAGFVKALRVEKKLAIDGGYGKIKGKTFRISNMGNETEESMAHFSNPWMRYSPLLTFKQKISASFVPNIPTSPKRLMKKLIIAEKPSVARDLAKALGKVPKKEDYFENDEWIIDSAIGHLVELVHA